MKLRQDVRVRVSILCMLTTERAPGVSGIHRPLERDGAAPSFPGAELSRCQASLYGALQT